MCFQPATNNHTRLKSCVAKEQKELAKSPAPPFNVVTVVTVVTACLSRA